MRHYTHNIAGDLGCQDNRWLPLRPPIWMGARRRPCHRGAGEVTCVTAVAGTLDLACRDRGGSHDEGVAIATRPVSGSLTLTPQVVHAAPQDSPGILLVGIEHEQVSGADRQRHEL